jgi:hypothetical protein
MACKLMVTALLATAICILAGQVMAQCCAAQSDLEKLEISIRRAVMQSGFYQTSGPNGEFFSERDHIAFNGCHVTLHVLTVGADEPPYERKSVNLRIVFNLRELSPGVVITREDSNGNKLPDNREWVILRTADGSESIRIWRGKSIASAISTYPLQGGANDEESQKMADAFSRAIAICK